MNPAALDRLRAGGIDRLVDLLIEDVLDRPARELVDPAWLGRQLAASAREASHDPKVEAWFRERVNDARARVPRGPVALTPAIRAPLRSLAQRSYVPDRELVGQLLDHDTARLLLKNLFHDLLIAFARKLRPPPALAPKAGLPAFKSLQKIGEGVLGAVGAELEQQVETKAREFMDAGVAKLVDRLADHLCNPTLTHEYGAWRLHMLDTILGTDARRLAAEVEKLDPESLVATGAALVRGIAAREELAGELEAVIRTAMDEAGDRTVRALLGGVEAHGIGLVRDVLIQRARAVVETEAFAHWWDEVVEGS